MYLPGVLVARPLPVLPVLGQQRAGARLQLPGGPQQRAERRQVALHLRDRLQPGRLACAPARHRGHPQMSPLVS